MKNLILFFNVFIITSSIVCDTFDTRGYCPDKGLESLLYDRVDKNIIPSMIIKNTELYENTEICWAGIIREYSPMPWSGSINFIVEHKYYNWVENIIENKIKIPFHNNGDGYFVAEYYTNSIDKTIEDFKNNNIKYVIIYGKASDELDYVKNIDGTVQEFLHINVDFVRFIDADSIILICD